MNIVILTPSLRSEASIHYSLSLARTMCAVSRSKIGVLTVSGNSILHMARNCLVAQAMAMDADKIVFIDDDVSWDAKAFERVITAPATIVAGVYQKKMGHITDQPQLAVSALPSEGADGGVIPRDNGLYEVDGAATGFLRIDRKVFEDMKAYVQKLEDDKLTKEQNAHLYEYFFFAKRMRDNKVYTHGEDYYFCAKAREAGHRTFVDPDITLGHHAAGMKFDAKLKTVSIL